MGQKVNPIGFRLGLTQKHRSRWYAPKNKFGDFLVEDYKIRKYIKSKNEFKIAGISKIDIERSGDIVTVIIHTASPGLLIGRRGSKVDRLTSELEEITKKRVSLKILELEQPKLEALLVAESVAEQLERRAPYRRVVRKAAELVMESGAKGVKVQVSGRIGGIEIARSEYVIFGSIPLHTLRADLSYGFTTATISKGTIGIKVWINRGEVLKPKKTVEKELNNEVNAQKNEV